jgi:hypothetical protein
MDKSIKNMHYDFKQRLNKIDSNAYKGLRIPEIDRALNRALSLYILLLAEPRLKNQFGFESTQRTIDDIAILVVNNVSLALREFYPTHDMQAILPDDYLYYISTEQLLATKEECNDKELKTIVIKHDSKSNDSSFHDSNFEWRECNIRFFNGGIRLFVNDFTISKFTINYIKIHPYIHNAEDFAGGTYTLPDGTILTEYEDCILPEITHTEIIDLAVLLTTGDLDSQLAYQFKNNTLKINQLLNN